jgi:hypothetical protein
MVMKTSQTMNKYLNDYIYFNDEWKQNTEQKTTTNGGVSGSIDSKEDDSKKSQ